MAFKTFFSELQFGQSPNSFFKNFQYSPADPDEKAFGELFLAIHIHQNPSAEVVAQSVFDQLQDTFFSHLGEDSFSSFETALREANAVLTDLLAKAPDHTLGQINAVAAIRSGEKLHLAQTGSAEAFLLRSSQLVRISEKISTPAPSPKGQVATFQNISSGDLAANDQIILATSDLLNIISDDELERIFNVNKGMSFLAALQEKIILDQGQFLGLSFITVATDDKILAPKQTPESSSKLPKVDLTKAAATAAKFKMGGKAALGATLTSASWLKRNFPGFIQAIKNFASNFRAWIDNIQHNTDKRTATFALIIMSVVLVVGVFVIWSKNSEQHNIEVFQSDFSELKDQVAKAERLLIYDPNGATTILLQADQEAERLLSQGLFTANIQATKSQIRTDLDKVQGIERISLQTPEANLASAKSGVKPLGLIQTTDSIAAFDKDTWFQVTLDKVSAQPIADDITIQNGIWFEDQEVTAFLTDDGRLIEWNGSSAQFVKTDDETFRNAVDIGQYSRFLYFLDPDNNQIWKYSRDTETYSSASEYNNNADLSHATSLAIDGDIYITSQTGDITQVFRGNQTEWFPEFPDGVKIGTPTKVRTSLEGKSIYVQDQPNRILKFQKSDGAYLAQYLLPENIEITDFIVDDDNMKLILLVGTELYITPIVR